MQVTKNTITRYTIDLTQEEIEHLAILLNIPAWDSLPDNMEQFAQALYNDLVYHTDHYVIDDFNYAPVQLNQPGD